VARRVKVADAATHGSTADIAEAMLRGPAAAGLEAVPARFTVVETHEGRDEAVVGATRPGALQGSVAAFAVGRPPRR
jgi:hypothetical protein